MIVILIAILIELVWITDHSSKLFSVTTDWRAIGKSPPGAFLGSTWLGNFFGFFTHADAQPRDRDVDHKL